MAKRILGLALLLMMALTLIAGCEEEQKSFILAQADDCRGEGVYCHEYKNINGGTVNLSFPSIVNETLNYTVQG